MFRYLVKTRHFGGVNGLTIRYYIKNSHFSPYLGLITDSVSANVTKFMLFEKIKDPVSAKKHSIKIDKKSLDFNKSKLFSI